MSFENICRLCDYQASTEIEMEAHIFKSHSDIFLFEQHPHLPNADAAKLVANPKTEEKEAALIIITEEIETTANNLPKTEEKETTLINISEKTETTVNYLSKTKVLIKDVTKETVNYFF